MKKTLLVTLLFVSVFLLSGNVSFAADKIVVAGDPPITVYAVDCHLRLLEFVLTTRLTVAQKNGFLTEITKACERMSREERADFLEAVALVESLSKLDDEQLEVFQAELADDFAKAAADVPDDVAAKLFKKLKDESSTKILEEGEIAITAQALDGFVEYLAFLAKPDQPVWYDASTAASIKTIIVNEFAKMEHADKDALEDFHAAWYMIRATWQNTGDQKKKDAWRAGFACCAIKPGMIPDIKMIKAALDEKIYGELIDGADEFGVEPYEWVASLTVRVW